MHSLGGSTRSCRVVSTFTLLFGREIPPVKMPLTIVQATCFLGEPLTAGKTWEMFAEMVD